MALLVGDLVNYSFHFILVILLISDSDQPVAFKFGSFSTWFAFAKQSLTHNLAMFSKSFVGFSVAHEDFDTIASVFNHNFLPMSELEIAFVNLLTFDDDCTMEKP